MGCACGQRQCRECRLRAWGQARRRYHWTAEQHELLRAAYAAGNRQRVTAALARLARSLGWPAHALKSEALRLGLALEPRRRAWTAEEMEYLEAKIGTVSVTAIARTLGRSVLSVESRAEAVHLSRRAADGYTIADLQRVLGAHYQTVRRWMDKGLLGSVRQWQGQRVRTEAVVQFLRQHPHEYDLRRVDQRWYKGMLFGEVR